MKKIYTLLLMLGGVFTATQAQVHFVLDGKVLQNGETVEFYAEDAGLGLKAETNSSSHPGTGLFVQNDGAAEAAFSVTVKKQDPSDANLTWCGITIQCQPMTKRSETRSNSLKPGKYLPMMLDAGFTTGEYATYKTTVTLTANGESTTLNVHFIYNEASGIAAPVSGSLDYAHNAFTYRFDTPAARRLDVYSASGTLVKSLAIGQDGTVSLAGLPTGVYVATVTADGRKVATRKCLVK